MKLNYVISSVYNFISVINRSEIPVSSCVITVLNIIKGQSTFVQYIIGYESKYCAIQVFVFFAVGKTDCTAVVEPHSVNFINAASGNGNQFSVFKNSVFKIVFIEIIFLVEQVIYITVFLTVRPFENCFLSEGFSKRIMILSGNFASIGSPKYNACGVTFSFPSAP